MDEVAGDRERSFALGRRASDLMQDYGASASPRAYAVWYAYVAGTHPRINEAIKQLTTQHGTVSDDDVDELHDAHLDGGPVSARTAKASAAVVGEIEAIMQALDLALGTTAQYGASLQAFSRDLGDAVPTRDRLRTMIAALVADTRDVAAQNRALEARMGESRNEINVLREALDATRLECLTDTLTGLSNRRHFEEVLRRETEAADAAGTAQQPADGAARPPASLLVIDIDFFKRFNDLYGHLTGDQVLRLVAIVMREHVGTDATLARMGGEEFCILLPATDAAAARAVAERIRTSVMARELVKRSTGASLGRVTVSLGLATRRPGEGAVSLMERADACLFAAKRAGRNRTVDEGDAALGAVA